MIGPQKQFKVAQRAAAEEALRGLSDKDKVHFALKLTGAALSLAIRR